VPDSFRAILLAVTVLVSACSSLDSPTIDQQLAHQVVFTVLDERVTDPALLNAYTSSPSSDSAVVSAKKKSQAIIDGVLRFHRLKKISQWSIKTLGLEAVVAEFSSKKALDEVVTELNADPRVESVESVKAYQLLTYNDPYFQLQSTVKSDDIENIHRLATGKGVVVGVVDTGIDRSHPELMDRIIYSRNFVAHDLNRFDRDEHGTTVAGVIGSAANNELGIVGVAPDAKFMAFKSCWEDRVTHRAKCDSVSLMKALVDVINQQPDIVNLSLAGPDDRLIRRLLKAASDQGIVLIAAVDPRSRSSFPAAMDEVIAVGTPLGKYDTLDTFGILAPGTDVLTTTPGATYAFRSGSSMATAYISGVAALMKERQPTLSGEQIRIHLRSTSTTNIGEVPVVDMCAAISREDESCQTKSVVLVSEEISPL
jgi:subtilisin family serine protease|tara:strand:- start:2526 stop:3800 length:1275 start_codon:yes stop_codon:yes gene_type:complete